jgi:hypothetical protein
MKKILIGALALSLLIPIPANADNANPPKIIELVQVSKGPYKPGDLVIYKVVYTGGNPGLSRARISFLGGCVHDFDWNENDGVTEKHGNGIFSSPVPTCPPGVHNPASIYILDKTGLSNIQSGANSSRTLNPQSLEISEYIYKPVALGEISPTVLQSHKLDILAIPSNPKIADVFVLPAVTSVGMPVYYDVSSDDGCSITQERFGKLVMPGGTLKITGFGKCQLSINADNGTRFSGQRPSFAQPIIESNVSLRTSSKNSLAVYEIRDTSKTNQVSKVLVCKKGKLVKKIKGINPKCPTGYKKA